MVPPSRERNDACSGQWDRYRRARWSSQHFANLSFFFSKASSVFLPKESLAERCGSIGTPWTLRCANARVAVAPLAHCVFPSSFQGLGEKLQVGA